MNARIIILSILLLNSIILYSQDNGYFSAVPDLGYTENNIRFRWVESSENETLYVLGLNITDDGIPTSHITKINSEGTVLETKLFDFFPQSTENMVLYSDTIFIFDVVKIDDSFQFRLSKVDTSLNLLSQNLYPCGNAAIECAGVDIAVNDKSIVLVGWANKIDVQNGILVKINKSSLIPDLILDTIPGNYDGRHQYHQVAFSDKEDIYVYFFAKKNFDEPGTRPNHGILTINPNNMYISQDFGQYSRPSNVNVSKFFDDKVLYYSHLSGGPPRGKHVLMTTNLDTIWELEDLPATNINIPDIINYTIEQDMIYAYGVREWHFGYNGVDFPIPDDLDDYLTAYLLKINVETGEKEWGRTYVEYDTFGKVKTYGISGMTVLKNRDLFCVGLLDEKDPEGRIVAVKPWIIKLPPDGCFLGDCEGMESFLSSSNNITFDSNPSLEVYPNPVVNQLNIQDLHIIDYRTLKYNVSNVEGKRVQNAELRMSDSGVIDFSSLSAGIYFLNIIDLEKKETYTFKIIKK
ncbi:T9SS type A sorting domain-containing protein [Portibacter marinus]|uniref:T9SS type A sorting domain-containing protein n=1 Tax=Portibacter marinus TaxID=2898660 RepID=UPI001F2C374A|nr:T9SS type A sorting domain-containing protein [Portibacter marinus]